jgi:transcription elongation GreA/GreB family factor
MPWLAFEAVFVRDDLRAAAGLPADPAEISTATLWTGCDKPAPLLEQISNSKYRRALESYAAARPESWVEDLLGILNQAPTKLAGEIAAVIMQRGHILRLKDRLNRLISQHAASSELLLWLGKERSDTFADVLGPEVFRAILTAIERDQFNEKKSNKLRDFVLGDTELLTDLIGSADLEVVKDLTRTLQLSPSFDDMDRRSLLARIVKAFPSIQALISGEREKQDAVLLVSWTSLERRQAEYRELVQTRIPANSRDIAVARSYGDLRENHEYKAAKEMQKVLMRRKAELERDLTRARGQDFDAPRTDVVAIGARVELTDTATGQAETYTILGAWDFDLERGVLSYLSPMAQALLNRPPGAEVEFEHEGLRRTYRINRIEPALPPAPASAPPPPAAAEAVPAPVPEPAAITEPSPAPTPEPAATAPAAVPEPTPAALPSSPAA